MEIVFWLSTALVLYIFAGYPILAWALARLRPRPITRQAILPRVTVITAAYNEADHIEATVRNKLEQDYPEQLLDVIVVSDCSEDSTDEIVRRLGKRVRLIRQEQRSGKTAALNLAVPEAEGEVLVFSDANSIYASDAIRYLVRNFADSSVGYVTGKMVYTNPDGTIVGDGCSAYMRYENWLRAQESCFGSVIGVDGGVDAVRAALYVPMRPDQLPDFVLPLTIAGQGYRVVYEPGALLYEQSLSVQADEYRMRVRVALRALWAIWDLRELLNPFRRPLLALQLISHKLLRYLAAVPLAAAWISSLLLVEHGPVFLVAAVLQTAFYCVALAGPILGKLGVPGSLAVPYYFTLLNMASIHALMRFLCGHRQVIWNPRKG